MIFEYFTKLSEGKKALKLYAFDVLLRNRLKAYEDGCAPALELDIDPRNVFMTYSAPYTAGFRDLLSYQMYRYLAKASVLARAKSAAPAFYADWFANVVAPLARCTFRFSCKGGNFISLASFLELQEAAHDVCARWKDSMVIVSHREAAGRQVLEELRERPGLCVISSDKEAALFMEAVQRKLQVATLPPETTAEEMLRRYSGTTPKDVDMPEQEQGDERQLLALVSQAVLKQTKILNTLLERRADGGTH